MNINMVVGLLLSVDIRRMDVDLILSQDTLQETSSVGLNLVGIGRVGLDSQNTPTYKSRIADEYTHQSHSEHCSYIQRLGGSYPCGP